MVAKIGNMIVFNENQDFYREFEHLLERYSDVPLDLVLVDSDVFLQIEAYARTSRYVKGKLSPKEMEAIGYSIPEILLHIGTNPVVPRRMPSGRQQFIIDVEHLHARRYFLKTLLTVDVDFAMLDNAGNHVLTDLYDQLDREDIEFYKDARTFAITFISRSNATRRGCQDSIRALVIEELDMMLASFTGGRKLSGKTESLTFGFNLASRLLPPNYPNYNEANKTEVRPVLDKLILHSDKDVAAMFPECEEILNSIGVPPTRESLTQYFERSLQMLLKIKSSI